VTRDAFLGVTSGVGQVRALRLAVASNETALKATEAGLRVGTRTIVDVLNIQRILFEAERDYARARYDYLLSVLRLKEAAGRLRASDLVEINSLLVGEAR
jgi:outer membrane protein